ncbi:MAG: hypothetical protein C4288_13865 [Leptolyngbya sp. ERB_1_1]
MTTIFHKLDRSKDKGLFDLLVTITLDQPTNEFVSNYIFFRNCFGSVDLSLTDQDRTKSRKLGNLPAIAKLSNLLDAVLSNLLDAVIQCS